ncbi:uncharacterized protein LOC130895249 [Diorhabda carinulata]|uniref:uncharacterized protein LOC130895249 n=1 Tax=Diorhabda carinulata TaxID=1163345 RepID=UPI0025A18FB7|nr:uncharacterized protein LOC130895249 [Diorhabda carinulata]
MINKIGQDFNTIQKNTPICLNTEIIETRLNDYIEDNRRLEKQMKALHLIVQGMYQDLLDVQQEREHLELHRKVLCSPIPCSETCSTLYGGPNHCNKCDKPTCEGMIRDLYKKYRNLQDIYKAKGTEVLDLRIENEILKEKMKQIEESQRGMQNNTNFGKRQYC